MQDITKANELILELASIDNRISKITLEDFDLFKTFFDKERETYGNTWTYITQGLYGLGENNLGYKFYDGENIAVVCFYPHLVFQSTPFYFIRPMGPNIKKMVLDVAKVIKDKYNQPVYVKKIFKNTYLELLQEGFSPIEKYPWFPTAPKEDDSFQERIIDINYTLDNYQEIGGNLPRGFQYYRKYNRMESLHLKSVFNYKDEVKQIAHIFFENQKELGKDNISKPEDYYNFLINTSKGEIFENIIFIDGEPVGFYYAEMSSDVTCSLYATLTDRNKANYLTDYIYIFLMLKLKEKGVRYINLGGSETKTLDIFKMKYSQGNSLEMNWAVLL